MAKITMKDVAQVCGVSVMSVSNAFNRPDQLSSELRERILARAEKMGYAGPDATARHLRSGKSHCYGVIFSEQLSYAFDDPFSVEWLAGFSEAMEAHEASVLLLSVPSEREGTSEAIRNAPIDGLGGICSASPAIEVARQKGVPVVLSSASSRYDNVTIDDRAAGREVAQHLVDLGHTAITLFGGPGDIATLEVLDGMRRDDEGLARFGDTWERLQGLLSGLRSVDLRVVEAAANSREAGRSSGRELFDRADRGTAIIAFSDVLALGAMDAMADRGLVPGRDVSVTGFDDLPAAAEAGLTTIRQPIREKGRLTAELLLDPERQPRVITLAHELIVRRSTGPVATTPGAG